MGESIIFELKGDGPFHCEGNEIRAPGSAIFTGGDFEVRVGNVPSDIVYKRNWKYMPLEWIGSEVQGSQSDWQVTVGGNGTLVTHVASAYAGGFEHTLYGPQRGGIMYEPATGKARRVYQSFATDSARSLTMLLDEPWPGSPTGQISVYFQNAAIVHNSGLQYPLGQCTTVAASATVTFVEALPASVAVGMYFYQNNNHWQGTGLNAVLSFNWGGVADEPVPRRRIVAIAGNRLSCTLDAPYGLSATITYSVTHYDGVKRAASIKAGFETKSANRVDIAGNFFNYGGEGERMHPTNQVSGGESVFIGTMHLSMGALTCTYVSGVSDTVGAHVQNWIEGFRANGRPWPYAIIAVGGNGYNFGSSVLVDQVITANPLSVTVVPGTNRIGFDEGDLAPVWLMIIQAPWSTTIDHVWRYNLYDVFGAGMSIYSASENPHDVTKGHTHHYHDNLELRLGDLRLGGQGTRQPGFNMPTLAGPANLIYTWGASVLGAGSNGRVHRQHNTTVHTVASRSATSLHGVTDGVPAGSAVTTKADDQMVSNDIMDGADAGKLAIFGGHPDGIKGVPGDMGVLWDLATANVRRNVYVGASAKRVVEVAQFSAPFPDNAGVRSHDLVGFHDFGNPDIQNPANYALDDIYTAGTVEVASDGLTVTRDGGLTFPALVHYGQFIRIGTNPAVRKVRVINGDGAMTANWSAVSGWAALARVAGVVRATVISDVGFSGMTYTGTALPNDQWCAVTLAAVCPSIWNWGLGLRFGAPPSQAGYLFVVDSNNGSAIITGFSGGTNLTGGIVHGGEPQGGDTYLFEAEGTTLKISQIRAGVTRVINVVTGTSYASGRPALLASPFGLDDLEFGTFTAGGYTSPGVRGPALITDDFSTGRTQLTLDTAYPNTPAVRGTTGNAYAITFKGSGTDGLDPGANIPLLMQWQQGVRRA